jgi:hypothetical protein
VAAEVTEEKPTAKKATVRKPRTRKKVEITVGSD